MKKIFLLCNYTKMGSNWYYTLVNAELSEIIANTFYPSHRPYGYGNTINSPIIALGESWAYYMGHYMADKHYGLASSGQYEQKINYYNNSPVSGLSSHLNLLEDFSPFRVNEDPFYWIPQGLFYDLLDDRNEVTPVIDQTEGYSNQEMFEAFQTGLTSLEDYKTSLLQTTTNTTSIFVNDLFNRYGY